MIEFIKSAKNKNDFPISNREVVFIGRSNVGKSSLINSLYGKAAYVGKTPGKTRMLNFFNVDNNYTVCDAPGYGYARRNDDEIIEFGNMMEEYFNFRKISICVFILDIRRIPNDDDLDMIEVIKDKHIKCIFVLSKIDKLNRKEMNESIDSISNKLKISKDKFYCISSLNKKGISELKEKINNCIE